MAINKIQTSDRTENILGNIGIKRNGTGYIIAGDMKSYNGDGNDNPFTIFMDLATINGKSINRNSSLSAGLMHLSSYDLYEAGDPTSIGRELYLAYLPFTTTVTTPTFPLSYSSFSSIPFNFIAYPVYERLGACIAAGIINLGRTVAMTLEEGDVLFGWSHRYRVRNSLAVDFIGKWYVIDNIDIIWVDGADRPEMVNISGHCVNRTVSVSYSDGVTSDVTTPDDNDTFSYSYSYRDFGGEEADEDVSLHFNSNYFRDFYSLRNDLPFTVRHTSSYYSSGLDSTLLYVVTAKMSAPPVNGTDGFVAAGVTDLYLMTIDTTGTPTLCYTENNSVQLYKEDIEQASETVVIGGNSIVIGYNKRTHQFNPNLPTLLKPLQPQLVSGTDIKTVNNQSILGEGNITIEGGDSYTAGENITIEEGVISAEVPQQRVLIDEDDDTGLHSGFIVRSPHWKNSSGDIDLGTWSRTFEANIPVEDADPYTQTGYLVSGRMSLTFKDLQYNTGETPSYAAETINSYMEINGTPVNTGETVTFTGTYADHTITSGDTIVVDSSAFSKISSLIDQELQQNYMSYDTVVYVPSYVWTTTNSAYVVHQGVESSLVDTASLNAAVSNAVGGMYVKGASGGYISIGKYTNSHLLTFPDADITVSGATTYLGKTAYPASIKNKLTNPANNLTVAFDTTYQEQDTVTYYSYDYGIEAIDFFGSNVYGGSWAGQTGTFVESVTGGYAIGIPLTNLAGITYGTGLCFYTNGQSGNVGLYLTLQNGALQVGAVGGITTWYDDMSGMNFDMCDFVEFVVNGTSYKYTGSGTQTLIADITNLTSLYIRPTSEGASYYSTYSPSIYIQVCQNAPSADNVKSTTLWPYEVSGYVEKNYENSPEKLNHYIRYAGATGSVVGNRKAYILTDLNVAQAAYIQQLETRIAALEARLNNYNGKNMPIEAQYPGNSMSG